MTSAGIRALAAAVLVAALATTGGCKEDSGSGQGTTQETGRHKTGNGMDTSETPEAAETLASVFPGSDDESGSGPTIHMSQARVNEPATGSVAINVPGAGQPEPAQNLLYRAENNGQGEVTGTDCTGPQPPNPCTVTIEHIPAEPGPYSGELVVTTADGSTTTYPVVGFAVGDTSSTTPAPSTSEPPSPETPETPGTTPLTPSEPTTTPPGTEDDPPST